MHAGIMKRKPAGILELPSFERIDIAANQAGESDGRCCDPAGKKQGYEKENRQADDDDFYSTSFA